MYIFFFINNRGMLKKNTARSKLQEDKANADVALIVISGCLQLPVEMRLPSCGPKEELHGHVVRQTK